MSKIIGNTTATPTPRSNWAQQDATKADFILNKPELKALALKDIIETTDLSPDLQALIQVINNFLDVNDTTTDQLSKVLQLIAAKINISDIINNLTTDNSNQVLSAAQGVKIKALIDGLQESIDAARVTALTEAEIDEICNTTIQYAEEVMF